MKTIVFTAVDAPSSFLRMDVVNRDRYAKQWKKLITDYATCNSVDIVFVFLTPGYRGVLAGQDSWSNLENERQMRELLEPEAAKVPKVQLIGVADLVPTLAELETAVRGREGLAKVMLGGGRDLYYDSPKMVEAIVRIARGRHCTEAELIFRVDADVAPNDDAFSALQQYFLDLPRELKEGYYLFSGGYKFHKQEDLINDYAVRLHHFADVGSIKLESGDPGYSSAHAWLASLGSVGADPNRQVISGAGLSLSRSAIRELPPFGNINDLVVWIDDHLKWRLHDELQHFLGLDRRRCSTANFSQDRLGGEPMKAEDVAWAISVYFPRLVLGCLMDAVIERYSETVRTLLNWRYRPELPEQELIRAAERRLEIILEAWQRADFADYPIGQYARSQLPQQGGRFIKQLMSDLHLYLDLLERWPTFVDQIEQINPRSPENAWLFRK